MTTFDAYKILLEMVEKQPDNQTLLAALNNLRMSVYPKKNAVKHCTDCDIYHGSVLDLRRKIRNKMKEIRALKHQLNLLMMPRPHRKIYTLPEVIDDDEENEVNDFEEAFNKQIFAPWRF
tara:strand:+ start:998 stop:1357 length:360 start_codon:yes stop_codon:yes gene_type:complete